MRITAIGVSIGAVTLLAQVPPKQPERDRNMTDVAEMPAEVHAPLFRKPAADRAGSETQRLTAGLPKTVAPGGSVARRSFIDD